MKRAGQKVYNSRKWRRVRKAYLESQNYICERCGKPATICHHKNYLTAANSYDGDTAYNFKNLEALCQDCHNAEHEHFKKVGAVFTRGGDVASVYESKELREFETARQAIADICQHTPRV